MLHSFTISEAKTQLSRLVALVERGEVVELRRGETPVARLVPAFPLGVRRRPGALAGRIALAEDFEAWPADVCKALEIHD